MPIFRGAVLPLLTTGAAIVCLSAVGQQGSVAFKHFKSYPTGQWSQQIQAYRNSAPSGPPQSATTCASPLTASKATTATKLGNEAAPMCRTKVLVDEERTAEYEQVCNTGTQQQVIHSTMRAIDDRTMSLEVRNTMGGQEMSSARITSRYVGACPAGQALPAAMPPIPKPSAEECAELPAMKQQAEDTAKNCTTPEFSASEQASCKAAMLRLTNEVKQMEAVCKK